MKSLPQRLLGALERFNAAHPWDHNAHYHRWILRQLPRRVERALDVGCGTGDLVRRLAVRADAVHGIDADPAIVDRARELTEAAAAAATAGPGAAPGRIAFDVATAPAGIPPLSFDALTCVATVHHLPFAEALNAFRKHVAPGGTLVIVGLARADTPGDHLLGAAAIPMNLAMGWIRNKGRAVHVRPVSMTAPTRPASMTFTEITSTARTVLPGARLRRRLFWRYTLVWRND
ncbi:class I SAM-dependent methyltransferase [Streptomyces sp. NPDC060031]|uniref:class I SAM-dependent methyltransferase n=1 Tax=Streptomyces sp. NPDC060031 TaxID=3347043 RepID=UPI00369610EE